MVRTPRTTRARPDTEESTVPDILVVSDDPVGLGLARRLPEAVTYVTADERLAERVEPHVHRVIVDGTEPDVVDRIDAPTAALVATSVDSQNLLFARRLQAAHAVGDIVVRVNDPHRLPAFANLPVETVDFADVAGDALAEGVFARIGQFER